MIGAISIALAGYQVLAMTTGRRPISHARGLARVGVTAWLVVLGLHLAYEWTTDDIGGAAARSFT